jgi:hypothetical protein
MNIIHTDLDANLDGFDVGISGAVPERANWTEPAQDRAILEFVSLLAGLVFKYGGRIVHGCHPTFTPVILRQAELHAANRQRPAVTICISDLWARRLQSYERSRFERESEFVIIPQVGGGPATDSRVRNASLTALRRELVMRMNVLVAVGGMQHKGTTFQPGVAEEITLARCRQMACFVVGGLGGAAHDLAETLRVDSRNLRNGLSPAINNRLLETTDVATSVGLIFEHFAKHRETVLRPLADLGRAAP